MRTKALGPDYAARVGTAVVAKDEDFRDTTIAGRIGNSRRIALLARVDAELPAIVVALERGETLIEII